MNNCILRLLAAQFFILQTNVTVVNLASNRLRSIGSFKVSSTVKNHHFLKFAIFRRLNRVHQGTFSLFGVMNEKYFNGAFSVRFNFHGNGVLIS